MRSIELSIGGMTCAAACAGRMERKLNRLDGVRASPNYAMEKASVEAPAGAAGPSWCGWSSRRRTARPASSGWRIDCAGCSRRGGDQRAGPRGAGWLGGRECHGVLLTGDIEQPAPAPVRLTYTKVRRYTSAVHSGDNPPPQVTRTN